jgi:hypothetical protein
MNDMTNDTMSDDTVIARLRSALDEVAATGGPITADAPDESDASVVTLRTSVPGRRPARTWLGVAAATVVLLGGAGWALSQRTSPTATGTTTTDTAVTIDTGATVAGEPAGPDGSYPWYELNLPDATAHGITKYDVRSGPDTDGFTQVWSVTGPGGDAQRRGVLSIDVLYNQANLPPVGMEFYTEVIAAPQGTAWLLIDRAASIDPGMAQLVWQRDDGSVWWVTSGGLFDPASGGFDAFAEYVFRIEKGTFNDLLSNPDTQAEWVGATPSFDEGYSQPFTVGETSDPIVLGVSKKAQFVRLAGSTDISEVSVAGSRAWRGTEPDGSITAVWPIDGEWWGSLDIGPVFAERADEIFASLTPMDTVATFDPAVTIDPEVTIDTGVPLVDQASGKPADAPSYVLADPAFSVDGTGGGFDPEAGTMPRSAVWTVDQADLSAPLGYVFGTAFDWGGMPYQADGVTYLDVSRNGVEAVLYVGDPTTDPPSDPTVYLPQADGVVWVYEAANLVAAVDDPNAALIDLAFALSNDAFASGSEPAALDGVTQFGNGSLPSREYDDTYTTAAGGIVKLTVHEGFAPGALRDATTVTPTTVLDRPAMAGTFADGTTQVVWQSADGSPWWVSLTFPVGDDLGLIDQAIAALKPA